MEKAKNQVVTPNATAAAYAKKAVQEVVPRTGESTASIVRSNTFSKSDIASGAWQAKKAR